MKQKHLLKATFALFIFFSTPSFAQDIIYLKSGKTIEAKVGVVGISEIIYKPHGELSEPDYIISKEDVASIRFESGRFELIKSDPPKDSEIKEREKPVTPLAYNSGFWGVTIRERGQKLRASDVREILWDHPEALKWYNDGKKSSAMGTVLTIVGAELAAGGILLLNSDNTDNQDIGVPVTAIGGAAVICGIVSSIVGASDIKRSIRMYNEDVTGGEFSASIYIGKNGIGLAFKL